MNRIAIVDIETTGFDKGNNLVVEVGIMELNPETGETKIVFDSVVRWTSSQWTAPPLRADR